MRYRCWAENVSGNVREIEANKTHSAALTFARELWDLELWEGDSPIRVVVQNPIGAVVVYPISAELDLRLVVGIADVRINSNGGPSR